MAKLEKEIKVLDINIEKVKSDLLEIGATFKGEKNQKIYVYDIPSIYYRYLEIRSLINSDSKMIISTNLKKLKNLILEYIDLVADEELSKIIEKLNIKDLRIINELPIEEIRDILFDSDLEKSFSKFNINPNKWIRLRETNGKAELTVKHILEKETDRFQYVIENEIEVSSLEETNVILESVGISKRAYQEKVRYSYEYKDAEIEIDVWPLLKPYLEIECDNKDVINEIIENLNLENHECVSLNTEALYKRINIDIHSISELKF